MPLDTSKFDIKDVDKDGSIPFTPKNPITGLTDYLLWVTPKSHMIWRVSASGRFDEMTSCERQQEVIFELLQRKYGEPSKPHGFDEGFDSGFHGRKRFDGGNCCIVLDHNPDSSLHIQYIDFTWKEQANKEFRELGIAKTDSSGL